MKKFDLEAAKYGAPIITRDGREAKFIAHVPGALTDYRVVWCGEDGVIRCCAENGAWSADGNARCTDLFMKHQKRTVWVNLFEDGERQRWCAYDTEEQARKYVGQTLGIRYMAVAVPIEIKE